MKQTRAFTFDINKIQDTQNATCLLHHNTSRLKQPREPVLCLRIILHKNSLNSSVWTKTRIKIVSLSLSLSFYKIKAVLCFKIKEIKFMSIAPRAFWNLHTSLEAAWPHDVLLHGVYEHMLSCSNCCIMDEPCCASVPSVTETSMLFALIESLCSIIQIHTADINLQTVTHCLWEGIKSPAKPGLNRVNCFS